jgi:hypothetical protein
MRCDSSVSRGPDRMIDGSPHATACRNVHKSLTTRHAHTHAHAHTHTRTHTHTHTCSLGRMYQSESSRRRRAPRHSSQPAAPLPCASATATRWMPRPITYTGRATHRRRTGRKVMHSDRVCAVAMQLPCADAHRLSHANAAPIYQQARSPALPNTRVSRTQTASVNATVVRDAVTPPSNSTITTCARTHKHTHIIIGDSLTHPRVPHWRRRVPSCHLTCAPTWLSHTSLSQSHTQRP